MPIPRYGVWKGKPISWDGTAKPDHGYLNFTDSSGGTFQTALNVMSKSADSRLVYWFFRNLDQTLSVVQGLESLGSGFFGQHGPNSLALDFLRGGFLDINKGVLLSHDAPDESHDILEYLDPVLNQAVSEQADVYIFGQRYHNGDGGPQNGMHDIHMNQGNAGQWLRDNGTYQDGGIILAFPDGHWEAIFLAFAVQAYETDDRGDPVGDGTFATLLVPGPPPTAPTDETFAGAGVGGEEEEGANVSVEAALINPFGPDQHPTRGAGETVYLLNRSSKAASLEGWSISNGVQGQAQPLHGIRIGPHSKKAVAVPEAPLSNRGGKIVLKNSKGGVVHEVTYSKEQAKREGVLVYFQPERLN